MFCRTECGYAGIRDVEHGSLDEQMPSFFLSETLKYLYLLFDEVGSLSSFPSRTFFLFVTCALLRLPRPKCLAVRLSASLSPCLSVCLCLWLSVFFPWKLESPEFMLCSSLGYPHVVVYPRSKRCAVVGKLNHHVWVFAEYPLPVERHWILQKSRRVLGGVVILRRRSESIYLPHSVVLGIPAS